ncbi:hypothetical protein BN77_1140 [Rhizobium mesoamericanum STM3625]|uniref:Uncharacterized protein n=1 Tax=Rhizobium mesoamericanum STM3625 TaxID=1211777 RepID=K0PS67_9HYPH|nr:hypothetical protein BN77_1140 [Rhizobium mesoamericanum STM3625]
MLPFFPVFAIGTVMVQSVTEDLREPESGLRGVAGWIGHERCAAAASNRSGTGEKVRT